MLKIRRLPKDATRVCDAHGQPATHQIVALGMIMEQGHTVTLDCCRECVRAIGTKLGSGPPKTRKKAR